jgi:HemY protein
MVRVFFFLLVVLALGIGFSWLADRPGDLVVTFGGYQYEVTLMVAAVVVVAIVAAVMIVWWLLKSIWNSPYAVARHFRARRRDRGYQSLSTGIIAAGAGDLSRARQMNRQAAKLISADQEPLIHLLEAQTLLLEGDHAAARKKFEAMLDDPELRPLALHGLYREAERLGDRTAQRHYAAEAVSLAPQLIWAAEATLEEKAEASDWDGALKLLDTQRAVGQVEKKTANRRRAVLLTAKAMSVLDADPSAAKNAALEAHRLEPDFVPAAVTAAKALFRQDDLKRGAKILEAAWKKTAHPQVAEAYVHARPGDSTRDRLARAKKLASLRQNNPESSLTIARAALDAGEFRLAREEADAAIRQQPREGAYLLRADIEEAETGDQGRVRAWLARAVRAPRDPVWEADGVVSEQWAPVSPVTGRLDAFEWREPPERLGQVIEPDLLEPPVLVQQAEEVQAAPVIEAKAPEVEKVAKDKGSPPEGASKSTPAEDVTPAPGNGKIEAKEPSADAETPATGKDDAAPADRRSRRSSAVREEEREVRIPPPPDDPGVKEAEEEDGAAPGRFRLF